MLFRSARDPAVRPLGTSNHTDNGAVVALAGRVVDGGSAAFIQVELQHQSVGDVRPGVEQQRARGEGEGDDSPEVH